MKNWIKAILIVSMVSPAFAGVIKEAQAQREVDDAKQALATMEARKELATFLPEKTHTVHEFSSQRRRIF